MERRFLLVGLYVVAPYEQGNVMQLALATLTAMIFLVLQSQAVPYRSRLDSTLATGCSFALCVLLTCCIFCSLPGLEPRLSYTHAWNL